MRLIKQFQKNGKLLPRPDVRRGGISFSAEVYCTEKYIQKQLRARERRSLTGAEVGKERKGEKGEVKRAKLRRESGGRHRRRPDGSSRR